MRCADFKQGENIFNSLSALAHILCPADVLSASETLKIAPARPTSSNPGLDFAIVYESNFPAEARKVVMGVNVALSKM